MSDLVRGVARGLVRGVVRGVAGSAWGGPPPQNQTPPAIEGTASGGETLAVAAGSWSGEGEGMARSYQWYRDGAAIPGASETEYLLTDADIGAEITVREYASNASGTSSALSEAVGPVASPYILDNLSVAPAAAWSMRRLSIGYEGNACTLIRASDSTTLAVGFDADGNFDASAAAAFLAATTGKGTVWNDQSGNANDASQSSDASRPAYTASAINSLPMWDFLGGVNAPRFNAANSASLQNLFASGGTLVVVMAMETTTDRIVSKGDTNGWAIVRNGGNPNLYCAFDTGFANARTNGSEFSTNAAALLVVTYDGGTSGNNILFYKDGSATTRLTVGSGTGSQKSDAANGLAIGARFTTGANPFVGKIAEVMLFRSVLSSEDRATLAADIVAYYGL